MICTDAELLTYLGKAGSATAAERGLLALLKPWVERAVKEFVGYSIEQAAYTHYLPQDDRAADRSGLYTNYDLRGDKVVMTAVGSQLEDSFLICPELPVRSITNVWEDAGAHFGQGGTDFAAGTVLTAGSDYCLRYTTSGLSKSGIIQRLGASWPAAAGTVKVTYTAGYTAAELAPGGIGSVFSMAVAQQIQAMYSESGAEAGTVKSESLGDWSATYAIEQAGELRTKVKRLLGTHFNYGRLM